VDDVGPECLELLSNLAWIGGRDESSAQAALDAGVRALGVRGRWRLLPRDRIGLGPLEVALTRLDAAGPQVRARVLSACVAVALCDELVTEDEAELVRAVSAALGLPMPPISPGPAGRATDGARAGGPGPG